MKRYSTNPLITAEDTTVIMETALATKAAVRGTVQFSTTKWTKNNCPTEICKWLENVTGVGIADMYCLFPLGDNKFEVTVKAEVVSRFADSLMSDEGVSSFNNLVDRSIVVTLTKVRHEVPDDVIIRKLSDYGSVESARRGTFREMPSMFNGSRSYRMILSKAIPSCLYIGQLCMWVRYPGQDMTCFKCDSRDHKVTACRVMRCFKCGGQGHVANRCPRGMKCKICDRFGHRDEACTEPVGLSCGSEWVKVEGGHVTAANLAPRPTPQVHKVTSEPESRVKSKPNDVTVDGTQPSQSDQGSSSDRDSAADGMEGISEPSSPSVIPPTQDQVVSGPVQSPLTAMSYAAVTGGTAHRLVISQESRHLFSTQASESQSLVESDFDSTQFSQDVVASGKRASSPSTPNSSKQRRTRRQSE